MVYPSRYTPLLVAQASIGWDQLFRGRWALQWHGMHQQYLEQTQAGREQDSIEWMSHVGKAFIQAWLEVWEKRVKDRHGKDKATQAIKQRAHILAQLEEL